MAAPRSPNTDSRFRPGHDQEVVKAWELARGGASMRVIAGELGCSVSTACTRVKEAREMLAIAEALDVEGARARSAASLDHWQAMMEAGIDTGEHTPLQAVPVLLKIDDARARRLGLDAAHRIRIEPEQPKEPARPDMALVEALRALDEHEAEKEEREATDGLMDAH